MTLTKHAFPDITERKEWLKQRKELLKKEKETTRLLDEVRAERRRLSMVKIDKDYTFDGPGGKATLISLFDGRSQLFLHHFMWFEESDSFCPGCSLEADQNYNKLFFNELHKRDVSFAAVCRAPLTRIEEEKQKKGWDFPFYSSRKSDFNYDFQATIDRNQNTEYNYQDAADIDWLNGFEGDVAAKSVFLKDEKTVYHTYSAYARGTDLLATHYNYLDLTPYGRQEAWENSPDGWPQKSTYE